jgi:uncharacterized membrane protein
MRPSSLWSISPGCAIAWERPANSGASCYLAGPALPCLAQGEGDFCHHGHGGMLPQASMVQEGFHTGVLLIDLFSALLVAAYAVAALNALLRGGGISRARLLVAEGAVLGLSVKVAAALLKTLEIRSWDQILMFAAIFALRTVLKQLFVWEKAHVCRDDASPLQST